MSRLSSHQTALLAAVAAGDVLKVHRTVDGAKTYRLHPLDNKPARDLAAADVVTLERNGLIASNMKFPAATFLLTERGAQLLHRLDATGGKGQQTGTTGTQIAQKNTD